MRKHLTTMQHAFLVALADWAARGARNKQIVIPTGRVDPGELVRVVRALVCVRTNRPASGGAGRKAA
jgi:hypothetical protein